MKIYAKVISTSQVSGTLSRIGVALTEKANKNDDLNSAVSSALPQGVSVVAGSFMQSDSADNIIVGFVKREREKITMDEAKARNLVTASTNVLLDPATQDQWDVVEHEGAMLVMKQETNDIANLLSDIQSASPYSQVAEANVASQSLLALDGSPFVVSAFVTGKGEVQLASLAMVDTTANFYIDPNGVGHSVKADSVIANVAIPLEEVLEEVASRKDTDVATQKAEFEVNFPDAPTDADSALDYFTRLYAWAPEVEDIAKQIIQETTLL